MSIAGGRMIEGVKEALSIAKGEIPAASMFINGHSYVPRVDYVALQIENKKLREAVAEQRLKPGVRAVIAHVHRRAEKMNHYPAKQWLNSLGFELGVYLKSGRITVDQAIDASIDALPLPPIKQGEEGE